MPDEDDRVERADAERKQLDAERRSLAALNAAYDGICADAERIRGTAVPGARVPLVEAFSNRLSAFALLLAAFEPLATALSEEHGRHALQSRIDELAPAIAWASRNASIAADVDRIFAEFTDGEHTNVPALHALERRLTDLDVSAAALEREGHGAGARENLTGVLRDVRAKIQVLEEQSAGDAGWQKFVNLVPAAALQRPPPPPAPQQPAADPAEDAEVRRIKREIAAAERATNQKIFEDQRKAQLEAFDILQSTHELQNKMKL